MVVMSDEWCDTNCPLCGQPLGDEQHFHLRCAQEENADAEEMEYAV